MRSSVSPWSSYVHTYVHTPAAAAQDKSFQPLVKTKSAAGEATKVAKTKPNDPCLCGSGKKFKKCCGGTAK